MNHDTGVAPDAPRPVEDEIADIANFVSSKFNFNLWPAELLKGTQHFKLRWLVSNQERSLLMSILLKIGICGRSERVRAMVILDREDMSREIRSLRHRAEEVRAIVEEMHDPYSRRSLLLIALSYERMACHLEAAVAHLSLRKAG